MNWKKILNYCAILTIVLMILVGGSYKYAESHKITPDYNTEELSVITNLDHDIYVPNVSQICDEKITGFDVTVGPTGWPFASKVEWEVALYENNDFYYARLIWHEYVLWWSFDDPYIVCKIPKKNIAQNLRTDEKKRWQVLYDITYTTLRAYDYKPYIQNSVVRHINGHSVSFGNYRCVYEKYFVISDAEYDW